MEQPDLSVNTPAKKRSPVVAIVGFVIFIAVAGWFVWDRFLQPTDTVTEAVTPATTIVDLREALNRIKPPAGSILSYHQAIDPHSHDVNFTVSLWNAKPASPQALGPLTESLTPVLSTVKASTWDWNSVTYEVLSNGSENVLQAVYSKSKLRRINLSTTTGEALINAADYHGSSPKYHW